MAAKLADRCEIQLAYAIGVREPVSVMVETFRTGKVSDEKLRKAILEIFDPLASPICNPIIVPLWIV